MYYIFRNKEQEQKRNIYRIYTNYNFASPRICSCAKFAKEINAGVLVDSSSSATLKNMKITTSAKGANAVFSTGTDSKIYISDSEISTTKDSSRGLDATYGGYIETDNVKISTQGGSCASLATDRGEGTVIAN